MKENRVDLKINFEIFRVRINIITIENKKKKEGKNEILNVVQIIHEIYTFICIHRVFVFIIIFCMRLYTQLLMS